jgi:hypothetical protein
MRALHLSSFAFAAVHLVASASPAFAQSATPPASAPPAAPGGDVIHLKNGGQIRGTIVDVIPGSHARIQLATGEITTVRWEDVARVESARTPMTPPPTTPTSTPRAGETSAHKLVHIDSPRPVSLQRRSPDGRIFVEVCSSPCDRDVVASGTFRVVGSGVRGSKPFELEAMTEERVFITVDPASTGWFVGGIILTSLGGVALIVGLVVAAIGSATSSSEGGGDSTTSAGLGITGVGILATVSGLVALVSNVRSTASVSSVQSTDTGDTSASLRRPIWLAPTPSPMPPRTPTVPIFTATF